MRNKIRRTVREYFRIKNDLKKGKNYVFAFREKRNSFSKKELRLDLDRQVQLFEK